MISCVCITHGRHFVLEEAIQCYLAQHDCGEDTELLILSDCPEQTLESKGKGVRVVNTNDMYENVSRKFIDAVRMAKGEYIAWWEDDDISLPWRLRMSRERIGNAVAYKQGRAWFWNYELQQEPAENLFFGSSLFRRDVFLEAGGPSDDEPADQGSWRVLEESGDGISDMPDDLSDLYWVYRWGGIGVHHDSGVAGTNINRFEAFRANTLANPRFRHGTIRLEPHWNHDYEALCREMAK